MTANRLTLRAARRDRPRMEMTALIDCVFLLLIFFLLTSSFVEHRQLDLELTPLSSGQADAAPPPLVLELRADGALFVEGQLLAPETMAERFAQHAAAFADQPIRLMADRKAPAGRLLQVVEATREAGLAQLELSGELNTPSETAP